ncbi:MAG: hypothetical protein ACE5EN_04440 [Nitrospinota bacterium]
MTDDLRRFIDKLFYLVPVKQWNAIAAIVIGGLVLGIGNTVLNRSAPLVPPEQAAVEREDAPLAVKKRVTVPDTISKGNIFRKQRQNYVIPPPPPPPPAPVAKVEKPSVEFKLVGTIISEPARIAIINADQKAVKRSPATRAHISGAAATMTAKKTAKAARSKKSESQSFHEGDTLFDYVLERVHEERIELVSLDSGESRVVYLEIEKGGPSAPQSTSEIRALKKDKAKPIKVSGAKTDAKSVN